MKLTSAFRTQKSQHWSTPEEMYESLNKEFCFDADPCPLYGGSTNWGKRNFINPPYKYAHDWLRLAESKIDQGEADLCVFLLPSRTGTAWFHEYANKTTEIRFIRGRLQFNNCGINAPFDSLIMVFSNTKPEASREL